MFSLYKKVYNVVVLAVSQVDENIIKLEKIYMKKQQQKKHASDNSAEFSAGTDSLCACFFCKIM